MKARPKRLLLIFVLLSALSSWGDDTVSSEKRHITIAHWGHEKILIYLPLYVAMDGGFLDKQGLQVTIKYSGNDDQVFATVISGAAEFGVGDPTFTAISREKGGPGKVVATLVGRMANWGVTNNNKIAPITDPRSLNGLRVTSFPSPSSTYTVLADLKSTLNLKEMQIIQMAFGTEIGAIERGDADIAIMLEPQTSIAVSKGYREVWSVAHYFGPYVLTGITTTDHEIEKQPDTVQKLVNGIQQALQYIRQNPEGTLDIAAKNFPTLDKEILRQAITRMVRDDSIPASTITSREAWLRTLQIRQKVGDLKSLDVASDALDDSFAEKASAEFKWTTASEEATPQSASPTVQQSKEDSSRPSHGNALIHLFSTEPGDWTWRGALSFVSDVITIAVGGLGLYWFYFYHRKTPAMSREQVENARDVLQIFRAAHSSELAFSDLFLKLKALRGISEPRHAAAILAPLKERDFIKEVQKADPEGGPDLRLVVLNRIPFDAKSTLEHFLDIWDMDPRK